MSHSDVIKVRSSRFRFSLVGLYLIAFLLLSGIHTGLIVLMTEWKVSATVSSIVPVIYWLVASIALTFFTRYKMRQLYERPMKMLAQAASQVARGDFSIYIPPINSADKQDYFDVMIGDFNRMVEALGSIETMKTDFISNVSHEIKTPLAVIQNTAELMDHPDLTPEARQAYVDTIRAASKRLSGLITNILKLNKLEKQIITPDRTVYDLSAQLAECAVQFEAMWEKKDIQFEAELEDKALITADPELMSLVWTNLLSNAIKFTPSGGTVSLVQRTDGDTIVVEVADTGCGMDHQTMEHIFDKFYQGDTSHATEGNGLGLALVQRVIQMVDAKLNVTSALGQGSVFTVRIAAAAGQSIEKDGEENRKEDKYGTATE